MSASRASSSKPIAIVAVVAIASGLLAWIIWSVMEAKSDSSGTRETRNTVVTPTSPGQIDVDNHAWKPAEVPVGMLAEYYDHITEHTPPRDPSGAMQRRERFYRAPGDPFALLESRLARDGPDAALWEKVQAWRQKWTAGREVEPSRDPRLPPGVMIRPSRAPPQDLGELANVDQLAAQSSLAAQALLDIGRAFDFLVGDEAATVWIRAALVKAQTEYDKTQPGDPAAAGFLRELDQTRALWRLNDYPSLEQRFSLAIRLYPALSVESRRAGCLHATALYYQGRSEEAADAILKVWDQDKQAGDLGALEKGDFGEMDWVTGLYLFSSRQYARAVPYYQDFLKTDDNRKRMGAQMFASCLTQLGRPEEAERIRHQYGLPRPATRPVRRPATQPAPG